MSMDRVKSNSDPTLKLNEIKRKKGMISIEQKKKWVAQMEFQSAASVSAVSGFHVTRFPLNSQLRNEMVFS